MKNYIFIVVLAAITLTSLNVQSMPDIKDDPIKITLPNGKKQSLREEEIRKWFHQELISFASPLEKINSLTELFDFIIAGKQQGYLDDIKYTRAHILIDQLNDAIRKEEQIMRFESNNYEKKKKINYAKNKINELQEILEQE